MHRKFHQLQIGNLSCSINNATFILQVRDLVDFHDKRHVQSANTRIIDFSNDGIAETQKSKVSLNTFTVRFKGCREVYAIGVFRPTSRCTKEDVPRSPTVLERILRDLRFGWSQCCWLLAIQKEFIAGTMAFASGTSSWMLP